MKKIDLILIVLILFFGMGCFFLLNKQPIQAQANECKHLNAECQINNSDKSCCPGLQCIPKEGDRSGNGKCGFKPTPTPTIKPTCTPTPTKTPKCEDEDCITPDFTPTPTSGQSATLTPPPSQKCGDLGCGVGNVPSGDNHTFSPNVCDGIMPQAVRLNDVQIISSTHYKFYFTNNGSSKYSADFGYSKDDLSMGVPEIGRDSNSFDIDHIRPSAHIWAKVWSYNSNGSCRTESNVLDP